MVVKFIESYWQLLLVILLLQNKFKKRNFINIQRIRLIIGLLKEIIIRCIAYPLYRNDVGPLQPDQQKMNIEQNQSTKVVFWKKLFWKN